MKLAIVSLLLGLVVGWEGHKLYLRKLVKAMRVIRAKLRGK